MLVRRQANTISTLAVAAGVGEWDSAATEAASYLVRHGVLYWQVRGRVDR
jgi:hypothetical protein